MAEAATLCELLDRIEDQAVAAPALLVRSIALLNLLPCHNSPSVRAKMKASYIFDTRDALLSEALHRVADLPCEAALELLGQLQPPVLREAWVCYISLHALTSPCTPLTSPDSLHIPPLYIPPQVCLLLLLLLLTEAAAMRLRIAAGELLLLSVLPLLDVTDKEAEREAAKLRAVLAKARLQPYVMEAATPCDGGCNPV